MKTLIASTVIALAAALPAVAQTQGLTPLQVAVAIQNASADTQDERIALIADGSGTTLSTRSGELSNALAIAIANRNESADTQDGRSAPQGGSAGFLSSRGDVSRALAIAIANQNASADTQDGMIAPRT